MDRKHILGENDEFWVELINSAMYINDINLDCITAHPEKNVQIKGSEKLYTYTPLGYRKDEKIVNFTFLHPVLHVPKGLKIHDRGGRLVPVIPLKDPLIKKYKELFKTCKKLSPSTKINSPFIVSDFSSLMPQMFLIKVDKDTTFIDKKGNTIPWEKLVDRELWILPIIQWQHIPFEGSLQFKLISAGVVDQELKEEDLLELFKGDFGINELIKLNQFINASVDKERIEIYNQETKDQLWEQIKTLANK